MNKNPQTLSLCTGLLVCMLAMPGCSRWEYYKTHQSPDGHYAIEIFKRSTFWAMPGHGGDSQGSVRLVCDGRVLHEAKVDIASDVDTPEWSYHMVHLKMVADWPIE